MDFIPALASAPSNPPNRWAAAGSLLAFAAAFAVSFWTGLGSLVCSVALLWLKQHWEGEEKDRQRQADEKQLAMRLASEEKQLAMKYDHKAKEQQKGRQHEKAMALINAHVHEGKRMTLAA